MDDEQVLQTTPSVASFDQNYRCRGVVEDGTTANRGRDLPATLETGRALETQSKRASLRRSRLPIEGQRVTATAATH
jgi:hypothetical protein